MKKILCFILIAMIFSISMVYAFDMEPYRGESCPTPGCNGSVVESTIWLTNSEIENGPHGSCTMEGMHYYKWDEKYTRWHCGTCGFESLVSTNICENYRCTKN